MSPSLCLLGVEGRRDDRALLRVSVHAVAKGQLVAPVVVLVQVHARRRRVDVAHAEEARRPGAGSGGSGGNAVRGRAAQAVERVVVVVVSVVMMRSVC